MTEEMPGMITTPTDAPDPSTVVAPEEVKTPDFDKMYQERKALIKTSDESLIEVAKKEGRSFGEAAARVAIVSVFKKTWKWVNDEPVFNPDKGFGEIGEKLQKHSIIDIGCGSSGNSNAQLYIGWLRAKKVVLVDPFLKKEAMDKVRTDYSEELNLDGITPDWYKQSVKDSEFHQKDGLGFLIDPAASKGNIFISNVDRALIDNEDYHKRLAQEVFMHVPDDGVFICFNSPDISDEASKLFPFCTVVNNDGYFCIFEKTRKNTEPGESDSNLSRF